MEKTNNKILVKVLDWERKSVPVMRNGKPTKRTKETIVYFDVELPATGYMIEGHELFIIDKDLEEKTSPNYKGWLMVCLYKADGTKLTCNCLYGRYGKANHEQVVLWNTERNCLYTDSRGWDGATWKGSGARMRKINW